MICIVTVGVIDGGREFAIAKLPSAVFKAIWPGSHYRTGESSERFVVWRCDDLDVAMPEAHQRGANRADLRAPETICRGKLQNLPRNESAHISNTSASELAWRAQLSLTEPADPDH